MAVHTSQHMLNQSVTVLVDFPVRFVTVDIDIPVYSIVQTEILILIRQAKQRESDRIVLKQS